MLISFILCKIGWAQVDTIIYSSNNKIELKGSMMDGVRVGKWEEYRPDGRLYRELFYNNNDVTIITYDFKTNKKFEKYTCKALNDTICIKKGKSETYCDQGNICIEGYYVNDVKEGKWIWYFNNGVTQTIQYYKKGIMHGKYISYNPLGLPKESGWYKNDVKTGKWKFYYENGEIESKGFYYPEKRYRTESELDSVREKDFSQYLILRVQPIYLKHGIWKYYSQEKKLIRKEKYFKGELINVKQY